MRIVFLSHHFPPEVGAPQVRVLETAKKLRHFGHDVRVLTCLPNQPLGVVPPQYRGKLFMREDVEGIPTVRTWVWAARNVGVLRRVVNQGSFTLSSHLGARAVGPCDVLVVESPPLLLAAAGYTISRLKGVPFVFSVADLWPESAVELGVLTNRTAIRLAEWLEAFAYRKAARIVTVTEGIREKLIGRGIPPAKIHHIPNGVDTELFRARSASGSPPEKLDRSGGFTVMYAGNIGLAQGLDVALEAAAKLRDVRFLLVGEGGEKEKLVALAESRRLTNVTFLDSFPRSAMPSVWNAADVILVTLKEGRLFEAALPSKIFEAMACERPIVLAAGGEARRMLERARAGISVDPGDAASLAEAILKLKTNPQLAQEMGRNGRHIVKRDFDRSLLARKWEMTLKETIRAR